MITNLTSSDKLRKALEWELSLSADDLRSHGWFHGPINRQRAEELLENEGDFLVRDCQSRPGDFVLSVKGQNQCLHFVINKVICQPHTVYERVQYAFEDDAFDTVPDLVTFYVGNRRPVSLASGAIISRPVNRSVPLSLNLDLLQLDTVDSPPPKPTRTTNQETECEKETEESRSLFTLPSYQSCIQPNNYHTYLLTKDNKPLEQQAIVKIHSVLTDTGARIIANHLTKCNLDLIGHVTKTESKCDFGLGVTSGLELILLPQGQQFRLDLIDRFLCLKHFITLSIVTSKDNEHRTKILAKWIQIAIECKTALGDCFGFECIIESLSTQVVVGLKQAWLLLRQKQTQTAINYETKLRPMLKNMLENSGCEQAPNTTFPSVVTLTNILSQHVDQQFDCFDLQQIYNHCEHGRSIINQLDMYKRNARIVLDSVMFEDLLLDMFRTEFHRKFLWGSKGCDVESKLRMEKLEKVIQALANHQTN